MTRNEYYKSDQWREIALQVKKRDKFTCTKCGAKNCRLNVHHLHYRLLFNEHKDLTCLTTLCEPCHRETHGLPAESTWQEIEEQMKRVFGPKG